MSNRSKKSMLIALLCAVTAAFGVVVYAYYTEHLHQNFKANVTIDLMFDMLSKDGDADSPLGMYQKTLNQDAAYDSNAVWGSEQNPYVISHVRHLQNLSILQNTGYFDQIFDTSKNQIPYFLVCNREYQPVVIDGTGMQIAPVGTDEKPFHGSIKGVVSKTAPITVCPAKTEGDKPFTADVSAIYNLQIVTDNPQYDYGLFGEVTCTGTVADSGSFVGTPSNLSDLLLVDVQVVAAHSLPENELAAWFASHNFLYTDTGTYTGSDGQTYTKVRETNHIGILAGHVSYSNVSNISVYYTDETTCALDISGNATGSKSNYYSATGIIGRLDHLNPAFDGTNISVDEGTSDKDLNYSLTSGGGKLSGTKTGYVSAKDIYTLFGYSNDTMHTPLAGESHNLISSFDNKTPANPLTNSVKMYRDYLFGTGIGTPNIYYYFYDGVFTFALSHDPGNDVVEKIWGADENNFPDITLGNDADPDWNYGQLNSPGYVATLTPVVNAANAVDQQVVLCYLDQATGQIRLFDIKNPSNPATGKNYRNELINDVATGNYQINCGTDIKALDSYRLYLKASGNRYHLSGDNTDTSKLGVTASGNGSASDVKFTTSYGNQAETGTGNIGWLTDTTRYSFLWNPVAVSGNPGQYHFSIAAAYSKAFNWFQYPGASATKYLTYNTGEGLTLSDTQGNALMLCTLSVKRQAYGEEDPDAPKGFVPGTSTDADGNTVDTGSSYTAKDYILYADTEYHYSSTGSQTPTVTDNHYTTQNSVNDNYGLGTGVTPNRVLTYSLKKYQGTNTDGTPADLGDAIDALGWRDSQGKELSAVNTKFSLGKGIDIGAEHSIFGSLFRYYDHGIITAPIGSDGTQTDMPTGSIAFKVNALPNGQPVKINVIVTANNLSNTDMNQVNSFGIWKVTTSGNFFETTSFNKNQPLSAFAIPNTQPLAASDTEQYILVNTKAGQKRTYLNGQTLLIAHTFTVNETGTYIMGSTNGPMNICYFSAEGVASTGVSQIGSIDYVYANSQNQILTVHDLPADTGSDTIDHESFYYPSLVLTYTVQSENRSVYVNNEKAYIRRSLANGARLFTFGINNQLMKAVNYSWYSDTVKTNTT